MHIVVAPDSFKGSLTAMEACEVIGEVCRELGVSTTLVPVADGGEGTITALAMATDAELYTDQVQGPYGQPILASRLLLPDGSAVVELAQTAGLILVGEDRRVAQASTYGVGQQILAASKQSNRVIVAIGGSASNDGGCGAAAACGIQFRDATGEVFVPTGENLLRIAAIDPSGFAEPLQACQVVAMCDVDNPLTGTSGAAHVFAPQKGADAATVAHLDAGLVHLAAVIRRDLGVDVESLPGAGAAGGMGAGLVAFFGAELSPGIDVVLNAVGFDSLLASANQVITGEGSFDSQSLRGKVIAGVARRAAAAQVPVHVLAGRVEPGLILTDSRLGIASAHAITPEGVAPAEAMAQARAYLASAARALILGGFR